MLSPLILLRRRHERAGPNTEKCGQYFLRAWPYFFYALDALASILERAGGGRAGLIQATIYLHDINLKRQMDTVWIEWIGPQENWPQRACVGAALSEGYLIEIVATAKIL